MHHHHYLGYFGNLFLAAAIGTMSWWMSWFDAGSSFLYKCGPYFGAIIFVLNTAYLVKKLRR